MAGTESLRRRLALEPGEDLPAFAWPGGYPIVYLDSDEETLCPACANESEPPVAAFFIHYEGADEYCPACNASIPSAYGDPDTQEETQR